MYDIIIQTYSGEYSDVMSFSHKTIDNSDIMNILNKKKNNDDVIIAIMNNGKHVIVDNLCYDMDVSLISRFFIVPQKYVCLFIKI